MAAVLVTEPTMVLSFAASASTLMDVRRWSLSAFKASIGGERAFLAMRGSGEIGAVDHVQYDRHESSVSERIDPLGRRYAAIGPAIVASMVWTAAVDGRGVNLSDVFDWRDDAVRADADARRLFERLVRDARVRMIAGQ